MRDLLVLAALLLVVPAHAVTIDWVTVGDPGNTADWTGLGAVNYVYRIGKYEVTNAQYAEFLNAVAATDTHSLYSTRMALDRFGGITRSGGSGSYRYSATAGREDMPVNHVSFWDALRFANWMHNGQPSGGQDGTTTEDGAYTITPDGIANNTITRNVGAMIFLTSEDEWYKAAYYDALSTSYFDYPAGTDAVTTCAMPGAAANTANCNVVVYDLTDVGSYTGSASPSGTFDQGGNVVEWNEAIIRTSNRVVRGGSFIGYPSHLAVSHRGYTIPIGQSNGVGFRVAMIPEPTTSLLFGLGLASLALRRRLSA
jgi:formylglycine-generating enzyme required for sulfatase activity